MWDINYYRSLAEKLKEATSLVSEALKQAGYSERVEDAYELIEQNELGIALENLCENLYEFSCLVPQRAYDLLEQAGSTMGVDRKYWEILKPQISS